MDAILARVCRPFGHGDACRAPSGVAILSREEGAMIKVGIVGLGVIGRHVAEAITRGIPGVALAGVTVRDPGKADGYRVLALDALIRESDLILEAATQAALPDFPPSLLPPGPP